MNPDRQRNLAASVRDRLRQVALRQGEEYNLILTRYALERLLYRLGVSAYHHEFVLKGALLFSLWADVPYRATRDLDLLGYGDNSVQRVVNVFRSLCSLQVADGLAFISDSVTGNAMKLDESYGGVRLRMEARLATARIPVLIDVGYGDAVVPPPVEIQFPVLLKDPAPTIRAYPMEVTIAEKFDALITLDMANSRMKDFYDLWILQRRYRFDGSVLASAVAATFTRRQTTIPATPPTGLTQLFSLDPEKQSQWAGFVRRARLQQIPPDLATVTSAILPFVWPILQAIRSGRRFDLVWEPGGPWR